MTTDLPPPEKCELDVGYVRLTDSAPLIVAQELGLYRTYGLDVRLRQEVSWANVRDKLTVGALDAAQMLAPLPAMTSLGASGIRMPMLSGLVLSRNGNTITLAEPLWHRVRMRCEGDLSPARTARALASVIRAREAPPTLAVVHPFSTHTILLRRWLASGGLDPDRDVRIIIVPPAQMVDSLANGVIEGFCAGEPWGTVAVHHGIGAIAAVGASVWPDAPEKVLCVTEPWHQRHPGAHLRLRLALMTACQWLSDPEHRKGAAELLAAPAYLDLPVDWLLPSLIGRMRLQPRGSLVTVCDVHRFGAGDAGMPRLPEAELLISRCSELLGRRPPASQTAELLRRTIRPELFLEGARLLEWPCAPAQERPADTRDRPGTGH